MFRSFHLATFVLITAMLATTAMAAEHNKVVDIGDKASAWENLPGVDGQTHSLSDLRDTKAVAVVFTCNGCPVAVAYQDRLKQLAADYEDESFALVAINVNQGEDLQSMKQRAEEQGFNFPYLRDDSQQSAKAYGATCTPHVFLLNEDRTIAYMGAIDDNWQDGSEASEHYLRDAIDATLAGETPDQTEARQVGCSIRWKSS